MTHLYQQIAERLDEPHRISLTHFFDREALRTYIKAKRGVCENMRYEGYSPSYTILHQRFLEIEEAPHPQSILLPFPKTAVDRLIALYPTLQIDNRSQYSGNTTWLKLRLNESIPANVILDLIDQAYAFVVKQLKNEERSLLDLMDGRPVDEAKIRALTAVYGLEKRADEIVNLLQPCISIQSTGKTLDYGIRSKSGGQPYLPGGIEWPLFDDKPLSFLAQINLVEIPPYTAKKALPSSGILYFFSAYGWGENFPWDDVGIPEASKVIYFNGELRSLRHTSIPDGMPVGGVYAIYNIRFLDEWSLPRGEEDARDPVLLPLDWSDDEFDQLDEMVFGLHDLYAAFGTGEHQLLGYYDTIQETMTEPGERLLIEIGSDYDNAGFQWGDGGSLFFIISEDDLKARRFDRVRVELQSG